MSKQNSEKQNLRPAGLISILLSIAAIASTAAYLLYRISNDRAYKNKWKDYDDCGVA